MGIDGTRLDVSNKSRKTLARHKIFCNDIADNSHASWQYLYLGDLQR